jgi:hypothetical protein
LGTLGTLSLGSPGQILAASTTAPYWASLSSLSIATGTGATNYIAKWTGTNSLATSTITDDGTLVLVSNQFRTTATTTLATSQGNVGIGTTTPTQKLHVEGQCVTGDTILPIIWQENQKSKIKNQTDNSKFKIDYVQIKDIKGGEYVLSLNEKTGKIEPARIKGLLDMGIKPIYKIETEDGKKIRTTGNHPYLVRLKKSSGFLGNILNPIGERMNNLPLNFSEGTELNKFNNAERTVLINGGRILMKTIPEYFSGGNNKVLAKCLSKDNNILSSDLDNSATFSSGNEKGACLISNPSFLNNSTTFFGRFSSHRSFNFFFGKDNISFWFNHLSSIFQSSQDSLFRKLGIIISKNFFNGYPGRQQIQNQINHNSGPLKSRLTVADFWVSNNVFIDDNSFHGNFNDSKSQNELSSAKWIKVAYLKVGDEIAVVTDDLKSIKFVKIKKIEILPPEQVYDIEVEGTHNFVANGIIAHNTYISATTTIMGNVGIGTATPSAKLHSLATNEQLRLGYDDSKAVKFTVDSTNALTITPLSDTTSGFNFTNAAGTSILNIDTSNQRVGIGTTAPAYKLEVDGALRLRPSVAPTGANGVIYYDSTDGKFKCFEGGVWKDCIKDGAILGSGTTNYLAKWTGSETLGSSIIYDNGANVGIGTTAPAGRLQVSGGNAIFDYSVGIGTATPSAKLHSLATNEQLRLGYDDSKAVKFTVSSTNALTITPLVNTTSGFNFTNAAGTSILNIDTSNQRVGIGTTDTCL